MGISNNMIDDSTGVSLNLNALQTCFRDNEYMNVIYLNCGRNNE